MSWGAGSVDRAAVFVDGGFFWGADKGSSAAGREGFDHHHDGLRRCRSWAHEPVQRRQRRCRAQALGVRTVSSWLATSPASGPAA